MNVKRIFIIIFMAFLISMGTLGYLIFYGVPFGNYIAKAKIKSYVKQVYGITEEFKTPKYNGYDSIYVANIPQEYSEVEMHYILGENAIYDERVASAYRSKFEKKYTVPMRLL